jgi:hypothetical protein
MLNRIIVISLIALLILAAGYGVVKTLSGSQKDKQIAALQAELAAVKPDTIIVQGKVDTVKVVKYVYQYDTIIVNGQVQVDTICKDSVRTTDITITGSTSKRFPAGLASSGCVAHYPSGQMDFTLGFAENPEKAQYSLMAGPWYWRGRFCGHIALSRFTSRNGLSVSLLSDLSYLGGGLDYKF